MLSADDPEVIYANVTVEGLNGRPVVDARPSDALNLALRTGLPSEAIKDLQQVELGGGAPPIEWH